MAATLWGAAALLLLRPAAARPRKQPRRMRRLPRPRIRVDSRRLARPAALLAGTALVVISQPIVGLVLGALLWWLLPVLVVRLDTNTEVQRQAALAQQLPLATGLLSACLAAGATLAESLSISAQSLADPGHTVLSRAASTAHLGGGPVELAQVLAEPDDAGWQALGAAVVRSSVTGAPLAELLHDQAEQALNGWFSAASVRARAVAVRTVLPLALCYLPAFLLLGVAPLVAGFLGGISLP